MPQGEMNPSNQPVTKNDTPPTKGEHYKFPPVNSRGKRFETLGFRCTSGIMRTTIQNYII